MLYDKGFVLRACRAGAAALLLTAAAPGGMAVAQAASGPVVSQSSSNDTSAPLSSMQNTNTPAGWSSSHSPGRLPRPPRAVGHSTPRS